MDFVKSQVVEKATPKKVIKITIFNLPGLSFSFGITTGLIPVNIGVFFLTSIKTFSLFN